MNTTTSSPQKPNNAATRFAVGFAAASGLVPALMAANALLWASGAEKEPRPTGIVRRGLRRLTELYCDKVVQPALDKAADFYDRNDVEIVCKETAYFKTNDLPTTWGHRIGAAAIVGGISYGLFSGGSALLNTFKAASTPHEPVKTAQDKNWRTCAEKGAPELNLARGNFALGRDGCFVFKNDKG